MSVKFLFTQTNHYLLTFKLLSSGNIPFFTEFLISENNIQSNKQINNIYNLKPLPFVTLYF